MIHTFIRTEVPKVFLLTSFIAVMLHNLFCWANYVYVISVDYVRQA